VIEQRTDSDCVFVCVAMAFGLSYEQLQEKCGAAFMLLMEGKGCDDRMQRALLTAAGKKEGDDYVIRHFGLNWCSLGFAKNMLWGRRAIVTVRSKNFDDSQHVVYWDGKAMFDPSKKQRWEWGEVEPLSAILFSEAPSHGEQR
jgi:hypothetical protein